MKKLLILLPLVLLLWGCGVQKPAETPEFVLTYAENQPEGYPTTQAAHRFAELVEERTGGKVVILVRAGGECGSEQEVLEQLSIGGVDFARLSVSSVSDALPVLNVLQLPFLYEDSGHMWRVLDGAIGRDFLEVFSEKDLVGLSWYDAGARCFYSNAPIYSAADLAGMTVRVQESDMMKDMVEHLGATPVTFAYSDVYAALETRKIDAAENNWPAYQVQEHYKHAKYFTIDQHTRVPEIQLASGRTWNQLPEEYRTVIMECAAESALYQRQLWTEQEEQSRALAIERGCEEILLSEEQLNEFRSVVQPLYESYCADHMDLIAQIRDG